MRRYQSSPPKIVTEFKSPLHNKWVLKVSRIKVLDVVRTKLFVVGVFGFILGISALFGYLSFTTDPYSPIGNFPKYLTVGVSPGGKFEVISRRKIFAKHDPLSYSFARAKVHLLSSVSSSGSRFESSQLSFDEIRDRTFERQFDTKKPYLVHEQGGVSMRPLDLATTYTDIFHKSTYTSPKQLAVRQSAYIQSTFFALESMRACDGIVSDIVTVNGDSVVCLDFAKSKYESLYSVLVALSKLERETNTANVAKYLKTEYAKYINHNYSKLMVDETLQSLKLSTAAKVNDAEKNNTPPPTFYDAVLAYKISYFMQTLGYSAQDPKLISTYKNAILSKYFSKKDGYFLSSLTGECKGNPCYDTNWLIVLSSGFFDDTSAAALPYYLSILKYIKSQSLDAPFGLSDMSNTRSSGDWLANVFDSKVEGISSHYSVEFIKMLAYICKLDESRRTCQDFYKQIGSFEDMVIRDGGFAKFYLKNGEISDKKYESASIPYGSILSFEKARKSLDK